MTSSAEDKAVGTSLERVGREQGESVATGHRVRR